MTRIDIVTVGFLKRGEIFSLCEEYLKRIQWKLAIIELKSEKEFSKYIERSNVFSIALDEKGKSVSSNDFSKKIENLQLQSIGTLQFFVGAADGLPESVRQKSDLILSFGAQTWPHMLVRVMLLEQIYRAQQIINGHPYHRE